MSSSHAPAGTTDNPLNDELHPALSTHEARVEADRCYFCFDAPCVAACPTGIDIPLFIRQIQAGNNTGSAKTIFDENIFGGMCARVCPTETLCEEACVRNLAEDKPVQIGLLQRHATDFQMATGVQPFQRKPATQQRIAVVGAGPAGIACAHRLALYGHSVEVFDAQGKGGGLNEYGIASYKTIDNFAQRELDYILSIGGITVNTDQTLGKDFQLAELVDNYAAVFLGLGLSGANDLNIPGEHAKGVDDAVEFISTLRQAAHPQTLVMERNVIVIGGGMTAIDAAVQARMLGAENVTIAYRRGFEHMNASEFEQELAKVKGVVVKPWLQPKQVLVNDLGEATGVEFDYTTLVGDQLQSSGETLTISATHVLKAIGQKFIDTPTSGIDLQLQYNKLRISADGQTSHAKIWAGGDCVARGDDLTVSAVQDGKLAAESIHKTLLG